MPPPTVFVLKQAYHAVRNALETELRSHGLTSSQWDVLKLLLLPDGALAADAVSLDQRAVQANLRVTSATLTRLLTGMEYRGLIKRTPHPEDTRSKRVAATAKARKLVAGIMEEGETAFYARVFRGFSAQETRSLGKMLNRIVKNLP